MEIITSTQNQWVSEARKLHQKKYRDAQGLFLAEGLRLTEEALKKGRLHQVFYHESMAATERGLALLKGLAAKTSHILQVTSRVLESIAETETPQGIVAVARQAPMSLNGFSPQGKGPLVVLDSLQDPGNLGTILRTLWAAGGEGLLCLSGTADPYNSKAVRASMGAVFSIPILIGLKWPEVCRWADQQGYMTVAGALDQAMDYRKVPWQEKTVLCIGNEGRGFLEIPEEEIRYKAKIPLSGEAESLNAAVAAGILLYESVRNRPVVL